MSPVFQTWNEHPLVRTSSSYSYEERIVVIKIEIIDGNYECKYSTVTTLSWKDNILNLFTTANRYSNITF